MTDGNPKPLLIVESPSKARTIAKYLGGEVEVLACVGHVKDLPKRELGVDVHHGFKMTLKILPERRAFIQKLKALAKVTPKVILATDPDREGEAIADHLASEIPDAKIERVQFHEITRAGIREGMHNRRPIDRRLVEAQRTRRIIDRLVGYKLSPLLWNTLQRNMRFVKTALSAGRVQSAAVKILVDRERLRAAFKQAVYFDLSAALATPREETFTATLHQLAGRRLATGKDFDRNTGELSNKKALLLDAEQAQALVEQLKPGPWIVSGLEEKPQTVKPRPPFTTSTLQQEAARKLRFSAKKTMRLAQRLYEAGYITYMRTDSTQLSNEALGAARAIIEQQFGKEYLPAKPVQYLTKVKNAQEAHEAIRPAGSRFATQQEVTQALDRDAGRLYDLIWKRTIASQMKPARFKQTTALIQSGKAVFRAQGRVVVFPGYRRVYVEGKDPDGSGEQPRDAALPPLTTGDQLRCTALEVERHETKPPPRFTEASLVKELESNGIGRPSTYATILDTIQKRGYVTNTGGTLVPTFLAVAVTQLLENHFEPLVDVEFTARMEDSLDAIARGELDPLPFMEAFYFGSDNMLGLEQMLDAKVDIRRACTILIKPNGENAIEARIGNYGPYLQWGDKTRSIPDDIALGDLTPEKAQAILEGREYQSRQLGIDPQTGQPILLKYGPYGPYVQVGDSSNRKSLPKGITPEEVDLSLALALLSLPRKLGRHPETGEEIIANYGRYGAYIQMGERNAKLPASLSPLSITLEEAIAVFHTRSRKPVALRTVGRHPETGEELILKTGRYGPYLTDGKVNASLPKGVDPESISLSEAVELINAKRAAGPPKRRRRKK
jgi:DNA topoisomerase-1